jgi:hypothetical protein
VTAAPRPAALALALLAAFSAPAAGEIVRATADVSCEDALVDIVASA